MMIKNLQPRLAERGKIKIGSKGAMIKSRAGNDFQPPVKLDHFVVTTLERGPDGNFKRDEAVHALIGVSPTRIPIRLLFDDPELSLMSRYACFKGKTMWCAGDGETATRLVNQAAGKRETVTCTCERAAPTYTGQDKCKINGALSVIIDGINGVGGVYQFRTTSYNSVLGLMSSLGLIRRITGGALAGIPLDLVVGPKAVASPIDGAMQTVYVVGLEYRGSVDELRDEGYKVLSSNAAHGARIEQIESEMRARLALPAPADVPIAGDVADDIVDEFYPNQHGNGQPVSKRPSAAEFSTVDEDERAAAIIAQHRAQLGEPVDDEYAAEIVAPKPSGKHVELVDPITGVVEKKFMANLDGARGFITALASNINSRWEKPDLARKWYASHEDKITKIVAYCDKRKNDTEASHVLGAIDSIKTAVESLPKGDASPFV